MKNSKFIEVTITKDTRDIVCVTPRKGMIRCDQITSFVDISAGNFNFHTRTEITLEEESDYPNDNDETGGVVRGRRSLGVQEDYATVQMLLANACQGE